MVGCKNGSTANPFVIPAGYRPEKPKAEFIYSIPSETTVVPEITIDSTGVVTFNNYTNSYCLRGEIIYKAV
jgi:hypothetical protein